MGILLSVQESGGERPYGGKSADQRRSARRERLVEAVLDLVGETGIERLSVGTVCERASVSKRHFYESVAGLDQLMGEALAEILAGVAARIAEADPAVDPAVDPAADRTDERLLDAAVHAVLEVFEDPRVARLYLEAPASRGLRDARDRAVAGFVEQLLTLLTGRTEQTDTARAMAHVVVAGTTEVLTLWLRGELRLEREQVVRCLVTIGQDAARHIRAEPAGERSS
jgi:AcrR family transcriptional regulator